MTCPPTSCSTTGRSPRSPTGSRETGPVWPSISGVGPAKLERYADEILEIVGRT